MKFTCGICGYVYDEEKTGVKFADLPDNWVCPVCGAGKAAFKKVEEAPVIERASLFTISYGLFVLTTKDGNKHNGCIINTLTQVTDTPTQIQITVQKKNYTCELIQKSKVFNISVLSEEVPFSIFQRFGFQCGRTVDKFAGFDEKALSANGLYFLTSYANGLISAKVVKEIDLGTHMMFIGEVTEGRVLSKVPSVTYTYYQAHIKPRPAAPQTAGDKWVCKICGYIYDDAKEKIKFVDLPDTWLCPLCKHPKSDFEKVK
ncbi:MAG: rubredoxin [Bacilli bacterium]|nr:rubredoxin [Bacilli bacterium]